LFDDVAIFLSKNLLKKQALNTTQMYRQKTNVQNNFIKKIINILRLKYL